METEDKDVKTKNRKIERRIDDRTILDEFVIDFIGWVLYFADGIIAFYSRFGCDSKVLYSKYDYCIKPDNLGCNDGIIAVVVANTCYVWNCLRDIRSLKCFFTLLGQQKIPEDLPLRFQIGAT